MNSRSYPKLQNFKQRTLTSLGYAVIILSAIFLGWKVIAIMFLLINALTMAEFGKILKDAEISFPSVSSFVVVASLLYVITLAIIVLAPDLSYLYFLLLILPGIMIREMYRKNARPLVRIAIQLFSLVYISIPFVLLVWLNYRETNQHSGFPWITTGLFAIIWIGDTMAYIVGSLWGKYKLFERISPSKTWEGTFAGIASGIFTGYLLYLFSKTNSLQWWLSFSSVIIVSGIMGDLAESLIKRSLNLKDSGTILPGHGGLLDRFDSLFFAIPAAWIFYSLTTL